MKHKYKICIFGVLLCLIVAVAALLLGNVANAYAAEEVSPVLYFGRNKLSGNNNMVGAYDAICKGISEKQDSISLKTYNLSQSDFEKVWELYRFDHVEHYWVPTRYSNQVSASGIVHTLDFGANYPYLSGFNDSLFASEAQKYLDLTADLTSEYEIALVLHDALVKDVVYNTAAANAHNAYGAIVEKKAVCEGYSKAYQYLLQRCGIQSYLVTGNSHNEGHEWNLVRLDGNYYYTDLTWDDPVAATDATKPVYHGYFNITTEYLLEDHTIDDHYGILPPCTKTNMLYKDMTVLSAYTVDNVAEAIKVAGKTGIARLFITGDIENFSTWLSANHKNIVAKTALANKEYRISYSRCGREYYVQITGPDAPATFISLDKTKITLTVGKDPTATITATIKPSPYCSDVVIWTSSNPSVATVDEIGVVTAKKEGTTTITAQAGSKRATCTVTVLPECYHRNKTFVAAQASTCNAEGWTEYYQCNDCNKLLDRNNNEIDPFLPKDPTNHNGDTEVRDSISATCQQAGYTGDTYCRGCGKKISTGTEVPQNAHNFAENYQKDIADLDRHYHICLVCGTRDSGELHSWNTSTATETVHKYCMVCGYIAEFAKNHTHAGVLHKGKDSTCTENGVKDYYECAECEMYFEDLNCTEKIVALYEWKVIPPSHKYGEPTWTWSKDYTSTTAKFVCTVKDCGDVQELQADVTSEETVKATDTDSGEIVFTATVVLNGVTYTTSKKVEIAPKLGYFFGTVIRLCTFGGAINGYLGFVLVVIGLFVLLAILIRIHRRRKRRRKRNNE